MDYNILFTLIIAFIAAAVSIGVWKGIQPDPKPEDDTAKRACILIAWVSRELEKCVRETEELTVQINACKDRATLDELGVRVRQSQGRTSALADMTDFIKEHT